MTLSKLKNSMLQNRLTVVVSITLIVAYLITFFVTQRIYTYYMDQQIDQRLINVAANLEYLISEIYSRQESENLTILGRLLLDHDELQYVFLYDSHKEISIFKSNNEYENSDAFQKLIQQNQNLNSEEPQIQNND